MVDVLFLSASRPEYLEKTLESFDKNVKYSGEIRFLFHEDFLLEGESLGVVKVINRDGRFKKIVLNKERLGQGYAISRMLKYIKSPIFFKMEDDWLFEREVNIDHILELFNGDLLVNEIILNKRETQREKHSFHRKEVKIGKEHLTTTNQWGCLPSFWRTEFIKDKWVPHRTTYKGKFNIVNSVCKANNIEYKNIDSDWCIENLGVYFLGKVGEPPYIKHIGEKSARKGEL